jgi:hypothetical protein
MLINKGFIENELLWELEGFSPDAGKKSPHKLGATPD